MTSWLFYETFNQIYKNKLALLNKSKQNTCPTCFSVWSNYVPSLGRAPISLRGNEKVEPRDGLRVPSLRRKQLLWSKRANRHQIFSKEKPNFYQKVTKSKFIKKVSMELIFFILCHLSHIKTVRLVYNWKDHELICL